MTNPELDKALSFAQLLATQLGDHILSSRNRIQVTVQKNIVDICTNIDEEVEKKAVLAIENQFPTHNIHSEECGFIDKKSPYTWYLDPIDGTKEFIRGIPNYNTCFTLETESKILLGIVHIPFTHETFSATVEHPTSLNNQAIQVNRKSLAESFVYTMMPTNKYSQSDLAIAYQDLDQAIHQSYRVRSNPQVTMTLGWIANGAAEGFYCRKADLVMQWHDVSAGIILVEQAGGKVTDFDGRPIKHRDLTRGIIATNGTIHAPLLSLFNH